jgi:hypothetical protein
MGTYGTAMAGFDALASFKCKIAQHVSNCHFDCRNSLGSVLSLHTPPGMAMRDALDCPVCGTARFAKASSVDRHWPPSDFGTASNDTVARRL